MRFLEKNVTKFEMLCEALPADVNWGDPITPDVVEQIILAEREACAKAAEGFTDGRDDRKRQRQLPKVQRSGIDRCVRRLCYGQQEK